MASMIREMIPVAVRCFLGEIEEGGDDDDDEDEDEEDLGGRGRGPTRYHPL